MFSIGACPELADAVGFQLAGVGGQDQLGALEHQHPGALGELAVETDHGAHLDRSDGGIQVADVEIVAGRQGDLPVPIAGVHLGVGQADLAMPVDQGKGVARGAGQRSR